MANMFHALSFKPVFFLDIVILFTIALSSLSDAHQERHQVYYRIAVLTRVDKFPEFRAVGVADDREISYYSNDIDEWIRVNLTEFDGTEPLPEPSGSKGWYKHLLYSLSNCTQCSELHVLQRLTGCELEKLPDGSVNLTVFDEYGLDGEDFISFNSDTMQWIDKNPKAKETKRKWDNQTVRNQDIKNYLKYCERWISTYNYPNKSSPDVRVFAWKADESHLDLICLATGFHPRDIQMNIRLDKTKLEDQTSSRIRPNHDGSFQMMISVKIHRNHEGSYDCLVNHSSLTEPVTAEWNGTCFNCETESPRPVIVAVLVSALVLVAVLVLAAFGYCIWKRLKSDGERVNDGH